MAKKPRVEVPVLEAPNAGELDVLSVLWREQLGGNRPLQLSEIHTRVCERRSQFGDPLPALTTTSSQLRSLVDKHLIAAATLASVPRPAVRTRGGYTPPTRASASSYQALHGPGEVLLTTFRGLALAYPESRRLDALLDFARALDLSTEGLRRLAEVIEQEKAGATKEETP
jgi:hypothetical protein